MMRGGEGAEVMFCGYTKDNACRTKRAKARGYPLADAISLAANTV